MPTKGNSRDLYLSLCTPKLCHGWREKIQVSVHFHFCIWREQRKVLNLQHLISLPLKRAQKGVLPPDSRKKVKSISSNYASLSFTEAEIINILCKPFSSGKTKEMTERIQSEHLILATLIFCDLAFPKHKTYLQILCVVHQFIVKLHGTINSGSAFPFTVGNSFLGMTLAVPCAEILTWGPRLVFTNQGCSCLLLHTEERAKLVSFRDTLTLSPTK